MLILYIFAFASINAANILSYPNEKTVWTLESLETAQTADNKKLTVSNDCMIYGYYFNIPWFIFKHRIQSEKLEKSSDGFRRISLRCSKDGIKYISKPFAFWKTGKFSSIYNVKVEEDRSQATNRNLALDIQRSTETIFVAVRNGETGKLIMEDIDQTASLVMTLSDIYAWVLEFKLRDSGRVIQRNLLASVVDNSIPRSEVAKLTLKFVPFKRIEDIVINLDDKAKYATCRLLIKKGRNNDCREILKSIKDKTSEWYFTNALLQYTQSSLKSLGTIEEELKKSLRLDPSCQRCTELLDSIDVLKTLDFVYRRNLKDGFTQEALNNLDTLIASSSEGVLINLGYRKEKISLLKALGKEHEAFIELQNCVSNQ